MSRKASIRKVTALVSALLFASASYGSYAKVIADDIDNEWAKYMNELTLKTIENENNCKLNFIYNSNSKYDKKTLNKIEKQLTKNIFNSDLSDEKITSKDAVSEVVSLDDGETTFDSCIYSFSIDNTFYYFDLKKITVSYDEYITSVTINLDELALIKSQLQKDDSSFYFSVLDNTNTEETCKYRIYGIIESQDKLYVKKTNKSFSASFDMSFGWICDLFDTTVPCFSNQLSFNMDEFRKHISLSQNIIKFSDDNDNILINGSKNYSQKYSDIRKKCIISTSNDDLWIKEIIVNNHSVYLAKDELKSSIDIAEFLNKDTEATKNNSTVEVKTLHKTINVPIYGNINGHDEFIKEEQYDIKINQSETYIEANKYLFNEHGVADYIISNYQYTDSYSGENKILYPQNMILEDLVSIYIDNYNKCRFNYQNIPVSNEGNDDFYNKLSESSFYKDHNIYFTNINKLIALNEEPTNRFLTGDSYYLIFDKFTYNISRIKNNKRIEKNILNIFPRTEDLTIIRGIIHNNEDHTITNSITTPIYLFTDHNAPIISHFPESTPWTNSTQTLSFTAKDFVLKYTDPYSHETLKFSSDITSFKIGAATVNKTDDGWAVTQGEDTVYTVDSFKQNGDTYTVEFSTPENVSHFENITINAIDEFGNASDDKQYTLKFDKDKPEITSISGGSEIRDFDGKMSVFVSDMNADSIIIKAVTNDIYDENASMSSGIKGGVLTFADSKEKYDAALENGSLIFKVPNTPRAEKFTITVTDNADNTDTFYFYSGENHVSKSEATLFTVDKCAPEITSKLSKTTNSVQTTLNGNQTWFNDYPFVAINIRDHLSESCRNSSCSEKASGIDNVTITYVCEDGQKYDIIQQKNGICSYSETLYIADCDEDPNCVDISLIGDGSGGITVPKNKDGKFEFRIKTTDRSGRENEKAVPVFYVDNKKPYSDDILSVKSKNSRDFGMFSNEDIIIEAVVHDDIPSSGIKKTELKVGNNTFPGINIGNNKWQYTISSRFAPVSGDISIVMYDNAGNEHETKTVRNPEGSNFLMIENNKPVPYPSPVITPVSGQQAPYICKNEKNEECRWYSGDVDLEFWWKDPDSGMDLSSVKTENKDNKTVDHSEDFIFSNKAGSTWNDRSDTAYIKIRTPENEDGKITFCFEGTDNCGNKAEAKEIIYKDITDPKIISVEASEDESNISLLFNEFNTLNGINGLQRYDYFSQKSIRLTIKAEDLNASSGLDYISYKIYNYDGTLIKSETEKFEKGRIEINNIPENFKGFVTAQAFDNVGNSSPVACIYGMISENEECHVKYSDIKIDLPDSEYTDIKGNKLYNKDITVNVSAEDTYSGINRILWNISNDSDGYHEENNIGCSELLTGNETFGEWILNGYEKNLATKLFSGITKNNNTNELKMDVSFTDNTGHSSNKSVVYSVDKDKPELTAYFQPSHFDEQYINIFNAPRTAVVQIKERNFNPDDTYIDAPGADIGSFTLVSGKEGTKDARYEAKVTFENDGEYKYSAVSFDRCKNESDRYESETFIIDRTAPKISVDFNDTASNGKYYKESRTAVITVDEQNFDENRIRVSASLNGKTDNLPELSAWTHNGNIHTAQMIFTEAGEYVLSVSGTDKASNPAAETFKTEFTIDKTIPLISFRGLKDKSANRGSSAFSVRITDKYLDLDSVNVKIDGAKRGENIDIKSKKKNIANGVEISFDNLAKEKEFDDVYHVTATAKDKAGNSIEKTLDFSVNRFGSTYIFDEATKSINRKYVKKPVEVVIHEINPDKLDPEKTLVVFAKDGISHIMNENEGFTLDVTGGNGKWYDYKYTFGIENFREDGAYYIMMYTEDVAGNANTNQEESQNAELRFGIDQTPPHLASVDLKTNGSYRAKKNYTARIRTVDLMFKEVHVYLNDSDIEEQTKCVDEYTYTFEVPAMEAPQKIRIVGYDYAGNSSEIEVHNVLVNPSIIKVLLRKGWFHLILAGVAGLIGWGLSKFIKRQKAIHDMAVKLQLK